MRGDIGDHLTSWVLRHRKPTGPDHVQANLLSLNLLGNSPLFPSALEQLRDRTGQAD